MTNPTTPFSWQMPTASDLVTDLPADFETFGQAVATSLADLLGGTTGQVLAKASNTDMDFTWTAIDPLVILDAKGDLISATAADTPARLAVGTNGQVLTADSTTATGLAWATPSGGGSTNVAGKNAILNSNFEIWQRGTSVAGAGGSGAYTADRWSAYNASYTVTQQSTSDTTNLPFINKCARVQRNSGATSTAGVNFVQPLESVNSKPFIGKVATLSFYARAGANYSSTSNGLLVFLLGGTGTDQNPNNTYTGSSNIISQTATLTTTWQRFTYTSSTIPTTVNELAVQLTSLGVGTAGANDYFEVTGVQLEIASSASAYSPNAATQQAELAACQRYYFRQGGLQTYQQMGFGFASTTGNVYINVPLPVELRVIPTSVEFSTLRLSDTQTVGAVASLTLISNQSSTTRPTVSAVYTGSGATQYRPYLMETNNSTSGYLAFSAEL